MRGATGTPALMTPLLVMRCANPKASRPSALIIEMGPES